MDMMDMIEKLKGELDQVRQQIKELALLESFIERMLRDAGKEVVGTGPLFTAEKFNGSPGIPVKLGPRAKGKTVKSFADLKRINQRAKPKEKPKEEPKGASKVERAILSVLADSDSPMSLRQIAAEASKRGLSKADEKGLYNQMCANIRRMREHPPKGFTAEGLGKTRVYWYRSDAEK
jgi:hypothetical protein